MILTDKVYKKVLQSRCWIVWPFQFRKVLGGWLCNLHPTEMLNSVQVPWVKEAHIHIQYLLWEGKFPFVYLHILLSITNKMQRYTIFFTIVSVLHVSGGFSAHHQELKNCTHSIGWVGTGVASSNSPTQAVAASKLGI